MSLDTLASPPTELGGLEEEEQDRLPGPRPSHSLSGRLPCSPTCQGDIAQPEHLALGSLWESGAAFEAGTACLTLESAVGATGPQVCAPLQQPHRG